ncbi:MAG: Asp-tRNA(Asn)/Glu-tRNA(Gln) amidotransferase subunit GatC [Clostridiales bacterium]|jgi:aspartyl-tRNA(Asn)/glutamyl-tRNA(Gln) amidotransferase subunit C|nr:Asp-tRNA(Asn)/Glu-tRNA(Gln) amidotransferase subunit GatC [Clostridiales bacterium]
MENIKDYEALAKLDLPLNERLFISEQADMLINSFEELKNTDTLGAQPLVTVLNIQNILRDDVAVKLVSREELLENAPQQSDGFFQVPKTLE